MEEQNESKPAVTVTPEWAMAFMLALAANIETHLTDSTSNASHQTLIEETSKVVA